MIIRGSNLFQPAERNFLGTGYSKQVVILVLLCLSLYIPGLFSIPAVDRDESRFAQASRQMLESGDYVRIKFQSEIRAKKPAGIYWLQALSAKITGHQDDIWAYRLPSVAGAIASVLLIFLMGEALIGKSGAFLASCLMAPSFLLVYEAHQAKTDAVLLACSLASQLALGRFYLAERRGDDVPKSVCFIFWIAQAFGSLVKGPIVPIISILTILGLWLSDRNVRWVRKMRPLSGLGLMVLIVAPWMIAVSQATQGQFIGQAVKGDLLPKLLGGQEAHGFMPGFYLLLLILTFWPGSLFLIPSMRINWRDRGQPAVRFLMAWIFLPWLLFELVPTKLPNYILPLYPALALLIGRFLADATNFRILQIRPWFFLWGAIGLLMGAAFYFAPMHLSSHFPTATFLALFFVIMIFVLFFLIWRNPMPRQIVGLMLVGAVIGYAILLGVVLPSLDKLWLSEVIAAKIHPGQTVAAIGYHEPSLVFRLGTKTSMINSGAAGQFLTDNPDGALVVSASEVPALLALLSTSDITVESHGDITGFDYTHGKMTKITIFGLRH